MMNGSFIRDEPIRASAMTEIFILMPLLILVYIGYFGNFDLSVVIGLCTLIPLGVRMILSLENTNKNKKKFSFSFSFSFIFRIFDLTVEDTFARKYKQK